MVITTRICSYLKQVLMKLNMILYSIIPQMKILLVEF
jgi:hypothetical protein